MKLLIGELFSQKMKKSALNSSGYIVKQELELAVTLMGAYVKYV